MKDNRIKDAICLIAGLMSELHNIPIDNYDWIDGKCTCLECGEEWYSGKHQYSDCKSVRISKVNNIALSFDEG